MRLGFVLSLAVLGCVDPNHGSRIVANFNQLGPPLAAQVAIDPNAMPVMYRQFTTPHYEMWATIRQDVVVDLLAFDVTPVVDINSPCLMYDSVAEQAYGGELKAGEPVMPAITLGCDAAGATCSATDADKYWYATRAGKLYGSVFAVTSVSDGFGGMTTLDLTTCVDDTGAGTTTCWLDHAGIVPGTFSLTHGATALMQAGSCSGADMMHYCLEPSSGRVTFSTMIKNGQFIASYRAHLISGEPKVDPLKWSNANRLRVCALPSQGGSNPERDPNFYIGNIVQLSAPRTGILYGLVDTQDPDGKLFLGGIDVVVQYGLSQASELYVTIEDRSVGSPDKTIGNQVDPHNRGPIMLVGRTDSGDPSSGRGLLTANLIAPLNISFALGSPGGHVSVYTNLDDDPVQF
jgi:hypothetical protein